MPETKGLYDKYVLKGTDLAYSDPEFSAVIISHPHFDHVAHLKYLDPGIPIYMGETCKAILDSVQETTTSFFFSELPWEEKKYDIQHDANKVKTFRTGAKLKFDDITVTPIHVDHSVPGAYGFVVETSEGTVAYSGDLRKHGNKPEMTEDFVKAAKKSHPDALIIEGTRVSASESRKNHTEPLVYSESLKVCKESKLVLAMRYPKDLDRFRSFYKIAKETGRTLVISLKTAHLLLTLKGDKSLALPDPVKDSSIRIYMREMKQYKPWEKPLLDKCINCEWVKKHQKEIIWELDFTQLQELIDVRPEPGGACIHSMSEPFEDDPMSQLQDEVLKNWIDRFSMSHYQLHASGHASKEEIFDMIGDIGAKNLIPVHTHGTELFPKHLNVQKGKIMKI
jgi:ribonuclease J